MGEFLAEGHAVQKIKQNDELRVWEKWGGGVIRGLPAAVEV